VSKTCRDHRAGDRVPDRVRAAAPGVWTAPQQPGTAARFVPGHSTGLLLNAVRFALWPGIGALLDVGVVVAVARTWPACVY
jgi:hypothetical protein